MSLDGRSRQALSVVLHHDRDALVSRQREEIGRLRTMMKNRYLRAALNLIDAKKEQDANSGHPETVERVGATIWEATLGPYYSNGDEPEDFHIPVCEKRAMITGLCALGYHVIDVSQQFERVMLQVCWWHYPGFPNLSVVNMQFVLEGFARVARERDLPAPELHLASPNPA